MSTIAEVEGRRRLKLAGLLYALFTLAVLGVADPATLGSHTSANHFALLAQAFLEGRLDLGASPPAYTGNNDFALHAQKVWVVFPPFPALLLVPWVWLCGGADALPDGLVFLVLAGLTPAVLFLVLEKLRARGDSARSQRENIAFALLFAFGSVYFFSAAQGTVWFAAHVVGTLLGTAYLWCALGAEWPLCAGISLGLAVATRTPLLFALPLFVAEALRAASGPDSVRPLRDPVAYLKSLDRARLRRSLVRFCLPFALIVLSLLWYNAARFGEPLEFGYRYLSIAWQGRIQRWGLFSYHYLARNLGVVLSSLPWVPAPSGAAFAVNHHGLSLWLTTPLFLLLPWAERKPTVRIGLWLAAAGVALPSLFYQNSGWVQFGYRFSNDFAPFLFVLLAVNGFVRWRSLVVLGACSLVINTFGALTFGRPEYARFYVTDLTQRVLYPPD